MIVRRILDKIQNQIFTGGLLAVFLLFFLLTVWGENGILKLVEMRRTVNRISAENENLLKENLLHAQEIARLNEPAYVEQMARSRLGYVRDDELVFTVPETE